MRRVVILLPVMMVAIVAATLLLPSSLTRAVQNPSMSLDMVTAGNTYCGSDGFLPDGVTACAPSNSMTVGTIDSCLTSAVANTATHAHPVHLIIQNVEDLVGWQARLNYIGDQMRPSAFNAVPFLDNGTGVNIGFATLPLEAGAHRDFVPAGSIPAGAPGPQTAFIGGVYNGAQTFPVSPDTPAKAVPDDTSYSTTGGGILATVNLQVIGDQSTQASLFMNLDDGSPNSPESNVQVFDGAGLVAIPIPVAQLGDGYHGEGATCAAQNCVDVECPEPPPTPTATSTATPGPPTPTATATPPATVTPTAGPQTPTATPGPGGATATATPAGGATTPTRTATPRASPAALPPTGVTSDGDSAGVAYLLLLIAGLVIPASGAAVALWRLRRDGWL